MFSQSGNNEPTGSCGASDAGEEVVVRDSVRSLLARPFYWLGYLALVFLLIFLWSAEHLEGASETDL
jgi:hypothetical protein